MPPPDPLPLVAALLVLIIMCWSASWLNFTCCLSELTTFCYTLSDLSDLATVAISAILRFITIEMLKLTTSYLSYNTLSAQSTSGVDCRGCRRYPWIFIKCSDMTRVDQYSCRIYNSIFNPNQMSDVTTAVAWPTFARVTVAALEFRACRPTALWN